MRGSKHEVRTGVWRLRVYVGTDPVTGAKRHASRTFNGTKRQAETALANIVTEASKGQHAQTRKTVAGLLDAYCDYAENIGRSPTTVAGYRLQARNLRDGIGRLQLAKLRPKHLDDLYAVLGSRGVPGGRGPLSPASANRYHALLSASLRQAVKWGWIDRNPADRATAPSEPKAKMTAPTPAELHTLIARAEASRRPDNALLIALAVITGARRGELCALRWSDIDLDAGVVHIRRSIRQVHDKAIEGTTKTHQERAVALAPGAVEEPRAHRLRVVELSDYTEIPLAKDPFVFSPMPDHGTPVMPNSVSRMFVRLARECGLPYHLHQLRHFAATQAIAAGYDPVAVAGRLGHSDASVTLRVYGHALEDRDRAMAETLGALVSADRQSASPV